ncbi:5-amino-6-(5-phosphoribosylamino)uracil reductase homolog [Micrococcus lylae]|uniref:5-amino-6-(5-phosphoribosylamino)uracil reductase homolog n=1 Tax=Micrococcus lylae TaxID=1273 RepID=A0A1R4IVW7_9MICC|nr:dihydrofolate reductase family protein [Micrococcus lylae]SJN23473.1 5-amino-6-(5-phosphoribosylamino)uracil reductase homolog [Micrococcus lylae]
MRALTGSGQALTDEDLLALYAAPRRLRGALDGPDGPRSTGSAGHDPLSARPADRPWTRMMFISSADGAATVDGRSGGLGSPADHRVFDLARRDADVILVGAGTVRAEGYDGPLVDAEASAWRTARGLDAHPEVAVVSGGLHLAASDPFFLRAPRRPVVLTSAAALRDHADRAAALAEVADVLAAGETDVDPAIALALLAARGHRVVHGEGGPSLFGAVAAAGRLDELQLSLSPVLVGGDGPRILTAAQEVALDLHLVHVLHEDSMLLLRYVAAGSADALEDGAAGDVRPSGNDV